MEVTQLEPALDAARDLGCRDLEAIADEQSILMGLPRELVLTYLRDNLNFHLDERERRGLELFFRRAAALQLIPEPFEPRFHDCHAER